METVKVEVPTLADVADACNISEAMAIYMLWQRRFMNAAVDLATTIDLMGMAGHGVVEVSDELIRKAELALAQAHDFRKVCKKYQKDLDPGPGGTA